MQTTVFPATYEGVGLVADPSSPECDALSLYLHDIGAIALLSRVEERDLIALVHAGDEQATCRFIEANLRLVVYIAKRYRPLLSGSLAIEDLIQAGSLGLMQAVKRYDPERGSFSNHAVHWIRQAISRTLANEGRTIRVPSYLRTLLARMARLSFRLFEEQGEEPTEAALAEAMGIPVEQVRFLLQVDALPVSLDLPMSSHDERTTLADNIADTTSALPEEMALEQVHSCERSEEIAAALSCLTEREQTAIILRFGLDGSSGHTLKQVGERMGISRERVRQLEASALAKLRLSPALLRSHAGAGEEERTALL